MEHKNKKLIIIGAGGHGKVCADIAMEMNLWEHVAFLEQDQSIKSALGIEVIGQSSDIHRFTNDHDLFVAIGNHETRERIYNQLELMDASLATLIHPKATIGAQVEIAA